MDSLPSCAAPLCPYAFPAPIGRVIAITDGSVAGERMGCALVTFNEEGLLATSTWCGILHDRSSWVAEWLAKGLLAHVLVSFHHIPLGPLVFPSDNLQCPLNGRVPKKYGSVFVLQLMVCVAQALAANGNAWEGYIPAQHDTSERTAVAPFQAEANALGKKEAAAEATSFHCL